jgi:hypothetical protein
MCTIVIGGLIHAHYTDGFLPGLVVAPEEVYLVWEEDLEAE